MTLFCSFNGEPLSDAKLHVPNTGPWVLTGRINNDSKVPSGIVECQFCGLTLKGTAVAERSGQFAGWSSVRVVAGRGGWGKVLPKKGYTNGVGVKASTVAEDAARECGEELAAFNSPITRFSGNYIRRESFASTAIEAAAGSALWWVDYSGKTRVGQRTGTAGTFDLLSFDAESRIAKIAAESASNVFVGQKIEDKRLQSAITISELNFSSDGKSLTIEAWCGDSGSRLESSFRKIVKRLQGNSIHGVYEYRVVSMVGATHCALRAEDRESGIPDLISVGMTMGLPTGRAVLVPGHLVYVQFVGGNPSKPIITGYQNNGSVVSVTLGGPVGMPIARATDPVAVTLPSGNISGTVTVGGVPSPFTGSITFANPIAPGTIISGSLIAKAG